MSSVSSVQSFLRENPFWLAPMAGVNDAAFRSLCKEQGAGLTFTEMVSAKGLHYDANNNNSRMLLKTAPSELPVAVQLFGAEPNIMAEQARCIAEEFGEDLACIDINMGCPVPKVVNKGEGSALMTTPARASEVVAAVSDALAPLGKQVTVKFRKGFQEPENNAVEFACAMEQAGAAALTVHGRYRSQYYKGASDNTLVRAIKREVSVPVLGSGDILTPCAAVAMLLVYGADGAMIARGAQGNPWIFSQARALYDACRALDQESFTLDDIAQVEAKMGTLLPTFHERFAMMKHHGESLITYFGEKSLVRMRKHAIWYCAGLPGASYFRAQIQTIASMDDLLELIDAYESYLQHH